MVRLLKGVGGVLGRGEICSSLRFFFLVPCISLHVEFQVEDRAKMSGSKCIRTEMKEGTSIMGWKQDDCLLPV